MRNFLKNRKGEGYIDTCVGVVCFCLLLVLAINLFSFVTMRIELDQIADALLESATESGAFSTEFRDRKTALEADYYPFAVATDADRYFNSTLNRVQLGERMQVTVSVTTAVRGLGLVEIPVTVSVKKTGLSERYWK